jgi:D-alanyl-D-alanine carboxypeptidase
MNREIKKLNDNALNEKLTKILEAFANRPDTNAVQFALESPSHNWQWSWSEADKSKQYFIASTTKLYVVALVMQLRQENLLDIDTTIAHYLPESVISSLHVYKGIDYSDKITVRNLLAQTSGIADYFEQRQSDGSSQFKRFIHEDISWTFEDVLNITKFQMAPKFAPSTPGKAFYSDTNYQLLGAILEQITGESYESLLMDKVIKPLGLKDTFPFTSETVGIYDEICQMMYGKNIIKIPKAMASVRADGGIVSSTQDGLTFLQAFMNGSLFDKKYVEEIQGQWNPIFSPFEYGMGMMRFRLPAIYRLFAKFPDMIGHSGASGTVLYYVPELDLYISGAVNQIKNRSLPYRLMVQIVMAIMKSRKSK